MKNLDLKLKIIFVLFILLVSIKVGVVNAQEASLSATPAASKISYALAYPGLLPDSPIYFLKAARDRVIAFFISDPIKKAEFELLQADKRVEASYLLSQKGEEKIDLAKSTFSKAENYFEGAIVRANVAKSQGVNVSELAKKLADANSKHQEVLANIEKNLSKKDKQKFSVERERLKELANRVKQLLQKQ